MGSGAKTQRMRRALKAVAAELRLQSNVGTEEGNDHYYELTQETAALVFAALGETR